MTNECWRKSLLSIAAAATLAFSCAAARASLIEYDLVGATTSFGTVTGTVTLDSLTGLVSTADITFNDSSVGNPEFTNIGSPNSYNDLGQDYISGPSNSPLNYGGQIALYYDLTNLTSNGDLNLCLQSGPCGTESDQGSYVQAYSNGNGGPFYLTAGSLDLATNQGQSNPAPAPEPSSLLLLGTGMVSLAILTARFSRSGA